MILKACECVCGKEEAVQGTNLRKQNINLIPYPTPSPSHYLSSPLIVKLLQKDIYLCHLRFISTHIPTLFNPVSHPHSSIQIALTKETFLLGLLCRSSIFSLAIKRWCFSRLLIFQLSVLPLGNYIRPIVSVII